MSFYPSSPFLLAKSKILSVMWSLTVLFFSNKKVSHKKKRFAMKSLCTKGDMMGKVN